MLYYIINGIEICALLMPAYIEDVCLRLCYVGSMYYFLYSDGPFYYQEIKNRCIKY